MQSPIQKQQATNTSNFRSNTSQEYVASLKHTGFSRPISNNNENKNIESGYVPRNARINETFYSRNQEQSNSRIQYSPQPGVIVHEYPGRPVRSPSPAFKNPNANMIPPANFIYGSPNSNQSSRVVNLSPPKIIRTQVSISPPIQNPQPAVMQQSPQQRMVPATLYESCVQQCKLWQRKYNQLYTNYLKMQADLANVSKQSSPSQYLPPMPERGNRGQNMGIEKQEYEYAMRENKKLREKVKQLQRNSQHMYNNMEDIITRLVNKYRDSTIKESMLLVDRYRLQKKMAEKM